MESIIILIALGISVVATAFHEWYVAAKKRKKKEMQGMKYPQQYRRTDSDQSDVFVVVLMLSICLCVFLLVTGWLQL